MSMLFLGASRCSLFNQRQRGVHFQPAVTELMPPRSKEAAEPGSRTSGETDVITTTTGDRASHAGDRAAAECTASPPLMPEASTTRCARAADDGLVCRVALSASVPYVCAVLDRAH